MRGTRRAVQGDQVRPARHGREQLTTSQESAALEQVKLLRHPFILSLERVEEIAGELVVVMELADQSLYALQGQYREKSHAGVPRDELLGYMLEAAEALDWLNFEHGLQHLDVKPHNLFLISGHVKVADFGLVHHHGERRRRAVAGSARRRDAAVQRPGDAPRHPQPAQRPVQPGGRLPAAVDGHRAVLARERLRADDAAPVRRARPRGAARGGPAAVARALAKAPEQRFGSCQEFVAGAGRRAGHVRSRQSGKWRRVLLGKSHAPPTPPASPAAVPAGGRAAPPETVRQMTETPTRRIRTLTPAQLAAAGDLGTSAGRRCPGDAPAGRPRSPRRPRLAGGGRARQPAGADRRFAAGLPLRLAASTRARSPTSGGPRTRPARPAGRSACSASCATTPG